MKIILFYFETIIFVILFLQEWHIYFKLNLILETIDMSLAQETTATKYSR